MIKRSLIAIVSFLVFVACTSGEADPSEGKYTLKFPSTAAAVATDIVLVLVFDVTEETKATRCQDLVAARRKGDALRPDYPAQNPAPNICELLEGRRQLEVTYGNKAILAIAQRKDGTGRLADFMLGCSVGTFGDGDAPLPIELSLIDVRFPVPTTTCASVAQWCSNAAIPEGQPKSCQ